MSKKVHCRSLSSIHILFNHDPVQELYSLPGRCTQFLMFHWTEVVKRGRVPRGKPLMMSSVERSNFHFAQVQWGVLMSYYAALHGTFAP